jgi:hypothetical protein
MTLLLHLGAPKTATSTLQNAFFPCHAGIYFLGKQVDEQRGWKGWRRPELEALMIGLERSNLSFRPDPDVVSGILKGIAAEAGNRIIVISSEDLCLFSGLDSFSKIARIRDLFGSLGPFRVVLAVREQLSLIKSIYLTEHRGEMLKLSDTAQDWYPSFDQYLDIHFRYAWGAILENFRFAAMIDRYNAIVGRDNVFVYAFDDFRRDPVGTLRALCRFAGIDDRDPSLERTAVTRENQHQSARSYAYSRLGPYLAPLRGVRALMPARLKALLRGWLGRGARFDFEPSPDAIRRIADYYRADNDALFNSRGIRL